MAAFAADQDIHRFVASQIYDVPLKVDISYGPSWLSEK